MPTVRHAVALHDWARPPYDVVWFSTARSYEWTGRPELGPTIVDLDNLEDVKSRLRAELLADQLRSARRREPLRSRLVMYQVWLNGTDWRRFQRSVAAQVERVVIASDLDAARSGCPTSPWSPTHTLGRIRRSGTRPPVGRRCALPRKPRVPAEHRRGAMAGDGHRPTHPSGGPGD